MKTTLGLALLGLTAGAAVPALATPPIEELVAAERAFARHCGEKGMKESFLAVLSEDSVLFRPGPVPGRQVTESRPAAPGILAWEPVAAEISAAGDLGYTTGPWTYRAAADQPVAGWGNYFSFWKRLPDGRFGLLIDIGNQNEAPTAAAQPWQPGGAPPVRWQAAAGSKLDAAAAEAGLLAADQAFATAVAADASPATYLAHLTADARLLRNGIQPAVGAEAAGAALAAESGALRWQPSHAGVALSGDFGYSYGTYERAATDGAVRPGNYVRAWRRLPDGTWKVIVDLLVPLPPPPPPKPAADGGAGNG